MTTISTDNDSAIEFILDGKTVDARPGETLLQTASRHGVEIPHLCYKPGLRADGNCRACMVEIQGERALAPSCCRLPTAGMVVDTRGASAPRPKADTGTAGIGHGHTLACRAR